MKISIEELCKAADGMLACAGTKSVVGGICIDSRAIGPGELFVAICGLHFDGHDFVADAVAKGAAAVMVSAGVELPSGVAAIRVTDTTKALGRIAAWWRSRFSAPCVAITGSNGKSTTKEMIAALAGAMGPVLKTEGNFNNLIGLPLTVFRWRDTHACAVLEMGMNAPGEIRTLTEIACPDIGVVTNVTAAHLEKLHTVEHVAAAKGELFEAMRPDAVAVVNDEDPWVVAMGKRFSGRIISFGMQNSSTVQFRHMVSEGLDSTELTLRIGADERTVHIPVPGAHNVMNALAAFAVGHALGLAFDDMVRRFGRFKPMAMRFECVQLTNGVRVVNDSYNANPQSMKAAFRTVGTAKRAGRFIAVLGDMYELGEQANLLHREVGEAAARSGVNRLFLIGQHAQDVVQGAQQAGLNSSHVTVAEDAGQLANLVIGEIAAGDVVLIKGSRAMRMERIAEHLKREIGTG